MALNIDIDPGELEAQSLVELFVVVILCCIFYNQWQSFFAFENKRFLVAIKSLNFILICVTCVLIMSVHLLNYSEYEILQLRSRKNNASIMRLMKYLNSLHISSLFCIVKKVFWHVGHPILQCNTRAFDFVLIAVNCVLVLTQTFSSC